MLKITGLLLSVMLLILPTVRCSVEDEQDKSSKNEDNNSSYSEKSDNNKSSDRKSSKSKKSKKEIEHWLTTIQKTEPEDSDGLAYIFDEGFTVPIDLSKVEGEGQYYDEIRESVTSDYKVPDSYSIYSEDDIYMPLVTFNNFSDNEEVSLAECYNNNWWYLDLGFYTEMYGIESLRGTFEPEIGNKPIFDYLARTSPVLDALIDKIGSPTTVKVRYGKPAIDDFITYSLIWENTDYVLEIGVSESYYSDNNSLYLSIDCVRYYTPEAWEYMSVYYNDDNYREYMIN